MKKSAALKKFTIALPETMADMISARDIIASVLYKALNKSEYYSAKCKMMEEKYEMNFVSFQQKLNDDREENFAEWDDLLLWEGYETAYQEWLKKYKDIM